VIVSSADSCRVRKALIYSCPETSSSSQSFCIFQPPATTTTNVFPASSNFPAPGGYNAMANQPVIQSTNPFEIHMEQPSSGDLLQPMNKPQSAQQQQQRQEAGLEQQRQGSTGDLHSSLSKVAKSLGKSQRNRWCERAYTILFRI
jgi:hypothetical protein